MFRLVTSALLAGSMALPSFFSMADDTINVLVLSEVQKECKGGRHLQHATEATHIKANTAASGLLRTSDYNSRISHSQETLDAALEYFAQTGIPNFRLQVTGAIPYYIHDAAEGAVSYDDLYDSIENDDYVRKYKELHNADIVWLSTKCINADKESRLGWSSSPTRHSGKPSSKLLTMITKSKVKPKVIAHELGHLFTLKHDVPTWYQSNKLSPAPLLPYDGVGVVYQSDEESYTATLMAYCPSESDCDNGNKSKPGQIYFSDGRAITFSKLDAFQFPDKFYLFKGVDFKGMPDAKKAAVKADILSKKYKPNSVRVLAREIPKVIRWSDTGVNPISYNYSEDSPSESYIGTVYNDKINIKKNPKAKVIYLTSGIDKIFVNEDQQVKLDPDLFLPNPLKTEGGKPAVNHTIIFIDDKNGNDHRKLLKNLLDLGQADYCALLPRSIVKEKAYLDEKIARLETEYKEYVYKSQHSDSKSTRRSSATIAERRKKDIEKYSKKAEFFKALDNDLCSDDEIGPNPQSERVEIFVREYNLVIRVDLPYLKPSRKEGGDEQTARASAISLLIGGKYESYADFMSHQ